MNCDTFLSLLTRWPDGELGPIEEKAMRDHAAQCPACAQMLAAMEEMRRTLSHMDDAPAVPAEFAQGWRAAVRREAFGRKRRRVRTAWQSVASVAAAIVLLLGGTSLWRAGNLPIAYPAAPEVQLQRAAPQAASLPDEASESGEAADEAGEQAPQMARMAPRSGAYDAAGMAAADPDEDDLISASPEFSPAQTGERTFMTDLAAFAGIVLPWALGVLAAATVAIAGIHFLRRKE